MRPGWLLVPVFLLLAVACSSSKDASPPSSTKPPGAAPDPHQAAVDHGPLPWIVDDYPRALAEAKKSKKPILIDMWAKWCHTCLSMQAYVFADKSMSTIGDRFVWLMIDTEKKGNAPTVKKFPIKSYPTFLVVDAATETVAAQYIGSMTIPELRVFLADGERAVALAHADKLDPADPLTHLLTGDRAAHDKRWQEAAAAYAQALTVAPKDWPRRTDVIASRIMALASAEDWTACAETVATESAGLAHVPAAGIGYYAVMCADKLPAGDALRARSLRAAEAQMAAIAADDKAPLTADDRGDFLDGVKRLREALDDKPGAKKAMEQRLVVLDEAAAKAPNPTAASVYDGARIETLLYLGRGAEAVAMMEKSEASLPEDYNPPARLARVHLELGRYGEALAAIDRALTKAYGPRKGNFYALKADILEKQGRPDEARKVLEEQLAFYRSLPDGQQRPELEARVEKRLAGLKREMK